MIITEVVERAEVFLAERGFTLEHNRVHMIVVALASTAAVIDGPCAMMIDERVVLIAHNNEFSMIVSEACSRHRDDDAGFPMDGAIQA